jgi:hypothetical protein
VFIIFSSSVFSVIRQRLYSRRLLRYSPVVRSECCYPTNNVTSRFKPASTGELILRPCEGNLVASLPDPTNKAATLTRILTQFHELIEQTDGLSAILGKSLVIRTDPDLWFRSREGSRRGRGISKSSPDASENGIIAISISQRQGVPSFDSLPDLTCISVGKCGRNEYWG